MGAKFKSKTHLLNSIFDFWRRFLQVWLQSLKKVLIWPKKNFVGKNQKRYQQMQNFTLIRWKSFKKFTRKVISKISLTNTSKRRKSAYFHHVFANNIFGTFLKNFFYRFEIGVKFCVFLYFFDFFKPNFFKGHINTFFKLWSQTRKKRLKNTENLFYKHVLEISYATIKGLV